MALDDFPEGLIGRVQIALTHVVIIDEIQVEIHFKHGLLDFLFVHARRGDDVIRHVDGADRQIFFVYPFLFFA